MSYIKVESQPYLVRDSASKAILNVNVDSLFNYKKERETRLRLSKLADNYEYILEDHERLKKSVDDINIKLDMLLEKLG
jgi:hypothetical protein